jgi:hypothetical protein
MFPSFLLPLHKNNGNKTQPAVPTESFFPVVVEMD